VKYTLDTNIFIDGFRNEEAQAEVFAFLDRELPFIYLSAVVMQELAAGARTARARRYTQTGIFDAFQRRRRTFVPSAAAFAESGRLVATLREREGWQVLDDKPSLLNDALIAVSCREQGITLITKDADFTRLSPLVRGFRYAAPWPTQAGRLQRANKTK